MTATRSPIGRLSIGLASALIVLGLAPMAHAQYTVPDCLIAAANNLMNDADYYAGRDETYRDLSAEWDADTAGLTPSQLKGYADYYCANLVVTDEGKDENGDWNWRTTYPSVDQYLDMIGQRRGQTAGGTSPATPTGGTNAGTATTGSANSGARGASHGGGSASHNQFAALVDVPSQDLLYQADFSTVPTELELHDEHDQPLEGQVMTASGRPVFTVEADQERTIDLPLGVDWKDYTIEARVRVTNASLGLFSRMADDHCAAYGVNFIFSSRAAQFHRTDSHCLDTPLQFVTGVKLQSNEWVVLRFDTNGTQFAADVDGKNVFTTEDFGSEIFSGFPALRLTPNRGQTGKVEIESLRIIHHRELPTRLTDYAAAPGIAVAELQTLGLAPQGGQLVFAEPQAYRSGSGFNFQSLAWNAPRTDIAMAASITFTSGAAEEYEDCGLNVRVVTKNDVATQEVEIVFDNSGYLNVYEYADPDSSYHDKFTTHSKLFPTGKTYRVLFTLIGEQLVAYVDGERILEVNNLTVHPGYYGISLYSASPNSKCKGENIWVYGFQ